MPQGTNTVYDTQPRDVWAGCNKIAGWYSYSDSETEGMCLPKARFCQDEAADFRRGQHSKQENNAEYMGHGRDLGVWTSI